MAAPLFTEDLQHVLDHTTGLWEELRGQKIFITGGTGFFGSWLLETFAFANDRLSLGAGMTCLTRDPELFARKAPHIANHPAINFLAGDVCDFKFPAGKFSHVIHAATTSSTQVEPLEMADTITRGTRRALDFAAVCNVKKFLFISSGAVYGRQPAEIVHVPESYAGAPDVSDPNSAYGEGKRMAELLCSIYGKSHGVEVKIARCFAFLGPHLPFDAHFAAGNFIRDALAGGPIRVNGDGTPFRSYLYAADLAVWLWTILFKGESAFPYNVGSADALTISELAKFVSECAGKNPEVCIEKEAVSGRPALRYVPDVTRAGSHLGLFTRVPLKDAIQRTMKWHRNPTGKIQ